MRIAYLINQYPKVSHSFIRREILELERAGVEVLDVSACGWDNVGAAQAGGAFPRRHGGGLRAS